ncbi:CHAT domain-containing protein, partial [Argonema antarcticum]|uniref:CHAT domain-containing protein n=1 Tax=Argonema antarcticum TaxID=2942763 RepID=UPI002013B733
RIRGERAENIEKAIEFYTAALTVRTRDAFPENWARTQNNLANAYSDRIRGERAENIEKAIRCYREALEVRTPSAFPLDCLDTGRNLGNLAFELQDWNNAIYGYENAISAVEQSREWATSQRSKREILQDALDVYEKMVQACINAERYDTALLTVERSKSRTLIELLDSANLYPKNATADQKQRLSRFRRQITDLQQQLDTTQPTDATDERTDTETRGQGNIPTPQPTSPATDNLKTELQNLQQQLDQLLIEIGDPDFTLTQKVIPQLPDFTQLLDTETALIEWYLPPNPENGFYVFLVAIPAEDPPKSPLERGTLIDDSIPPLFKGGQGGDRIQIQHLAFSGEDRQQLDIHIATYRSDYSQFTWQEALRPRLEAISQSLQLNSIRAKLPETIQKLILVPHLDLHLIPLHALSVEGKILQDCYPNGIQYAPSCQFLERLHQRQRQSPNKPPLFAIQNPTEDLNYTEIEVETISRQFDPDTHILKRRQATKIALNSPETLAKLSLAYYAHFSCHGSFNPNYPLNSALVLATETAIADPQPAEETADSEKEKRYVTIRDGRRFDTTTQGLTLREIFANLDLPVCRLVTLSACETGLVDTALTDEYIGLASGFLYAGATNVVSSLWSVSDLATAFLMIRFYLELAKKPSLSVAVALKKAQNWLRNLSREDFLKELDTLKLDEERGKGIDRWLISNGDEPFPFENPAYWAAFCAIGL